MAVPPPTKAELRAEALARRVSYTNNLDAKARNDLEERACARIVVHLRHAEVVGLYAPLRAELSPLALADLCPQVAFPWFADRGAIMMFRAGPADTPGPWNVLQPAPDSPALAPDAVIVPLVLADTRGSRIGHGKGHYDRALANLRAAKGRVLTIGLAWDWQIVDEPLPADPWDVPLDALATPERWIDCR